MTTRSSKNLCVISQAQKQEYAPEFEALERQGVEFLFESSPEKALALIGRLEPTMVVVGTEVGEMEGIEFLTRMMHRYGHYDRPVIVLSDKDDGLPPMLHSREQSGSRSSVEQIDFVEIVRLAKILA